MDNLKNYLQGVVTELNSSPKPNQFKKRTAFAKANAFLIENSITDVTPQQIDDLIEELVGAN